jgi:hypothetical protein
MTRAPRIIDVTRLCRRPAPAVLQSPRGQTYVHRRSENVRESSRHALGMSLSSRSTRAFLLPLSIDSIAIH